jgi:hypothetical protein
LQQELRVELRREKQSVDMRNNCQAAHVKRRIVEGVWHGTRRPSEQAVRPARGPSVHGTHLLADGVPLDGLA